MTHPDQLQKDNIEEVELRLLCAIWSLEDALIDIRKLTQDIQIRLERIENQNARDSK